MTQDTKTPPDAAEPAAGQLHPKMEPGEYARMRAECWYNLPEIVNAVVVFVGIWWWVPEGEWVRSPLWLIGLAFTVGFALRMLQLVTYNEVLNQIVFNTFGHNVWLWLLVIGEVAWFLDRYKAFTVVVFLLAYHLVGSNWVDIPGRLLVDKVHGLKAKDAFEARIRARDGLPPIERA